ncbi:hypothetical protein [Cysteiniphilum sp. QT6929]|nr:hypothetical protein [Cysteiniphilum sp. QT6929]WHN65722.1 hypothetical protein NYP54_00440 [Cysteiniphilum sp. QT6929]
MSKITFEKETKLIDFDKDQPKRIIFSFNSESATPDENDESVVYECRKR